MTRSSNVVLTYFSLSVLLSFSSQALAGEMSQTTKHFGVLKLFEEQYNSYLNPNNKETILNYTINIIKLKTIILNL